MVTHNRRDCREPEAGSLAGVFRSEERFEDLASNLRGNTVAGVSDFNNDVRPDRQPRIHLNVGFVQKNVLPGDGQLPSIGHRVARIDAKIHQHLVDLRGIRRQHPQVSRHIQNNRN